MPTGVESGSYKKVLKDYGGDNPLIVKGKNPLYVSTLSQLVDGQDPWIREATPLSPEEAQKRRGEPRIVERGD